MARINDLTTFPNQTDVAPDDHLLGTDVSDTTNSSDGETRTFAIRDLGKVYAVGNRWAPYDSSGSWGTHEGDGSDGILYDHSVDGTVSSVGPFSLDVDYEYLFEFDGISETLVGSSQNWGFSTAQGNASLISSVPHTSGVYGRTTVLGRAETINTTSLASNNLTTITFQWLSGSSIDAGTIKVWRRKVATL